MAFSSDSNPTNPRRTATAQTRNEDSMIISKAYAKRLAKAGKAVIINGDTCTDNGRHYQIVARLDVQRFDHYEID